MREYTFSRARQQFAGMLDQAAQDGAVRIRRRDGQVFEVRPAEQSGASPLEVPGVSLNLTRGELLSALAESRASGARFVSERPPRRRAR
ncbi:MAG: type II toxin-antitoxin system Phd/YefM family antitoxin [Gemmatimonadetes bacterium]|nr:type II toxin-antitoxin system Phd/YefM family antitoxin [Gemmatimonadota bacterium]